MKKKKSVGKDKGEKVCEIFKIKKGDKEKTKKVCGTEEQKHSTKKQIEEQNKTLRKVFIGIGFLIFIIILFVLINYYQTHFEYEGVKFKIVREGKIIFYQTSLPVIYKGELRQYNFYLRNDPRKLKEIPIKGEIDFKQNMVIELTTEELFCDGDWNLAMGNLQKLYSILTINLLVNNDSEIYEPKEEYMFITIQLNNNTNIEKVEGNSYNLNVNNCEILKVTERLMIETFIQVNKIVI